MVLLNYLVDGTHFCGANHTYENFCCCCCVEKSWRECVASKRCSDQDILVARSGD